LEPLKDHVLTDSDFGRLISPRTFTQVTVSPTKDRSKYPRVISSSESIPTYSDYAKTHVCNNPNHEFLKQGIPNQNGLSLFGTEDLCNHASGISESSRRCAAGRPARSAPLCSPRFIPCIPYRSAFTRSERQNYCIAERIAAMLDHAWMLAR
jgi:hypothetical protein